MGSNLRSFAVFWISLVCIASLGCVSIQTDWSVDEALDLSGRKTFAIDQATDPPGGTSEADAKLWNQRRDLVRRLIRDDLVAKGWREDAEAPDLRVHYRIGRGSAAMVAYRVDARFEKEQMGKVDIVVTDPADGKWLWHGWATETIVERLDANEEISKAVPMILSRFPRAS
jgi:hypothetical protein